MHFDNTISLADIVAIVLGFMGALLGVLNIWKAMNDDKVKLTVTPKRAIPMGPHHANVDFCIEVTNRSLFPVTISEAGFLLSGTTSRAAVPLPILIDGGTFPRRLEARSSVTLYLQAPMAKPGTRVKCAYAKTDCGEIRTGKSPALEFLR